MIPKRTLRWLCTSFFFAVPFYSFAETNAQVYARNSERVIRSDDSMPLVVQVGVDAGYLTHATTIPREGPYTGGLLAGKSLLSFLFENWILESGLGWSYSALYGTTKGPNPTDPALGQRIYTQSAFAEAGTRFRITPRVNFGVVLQDYFGTDLSLSQRNGMVNNMFLGGGLFAIDILKESGIFRVTGQLMAEIPDNKRQVVLYSAGLQFGIPIQDYDVLLRNTDVYVKREKVQKVEIPKVVTRTVQRDVAKISLPLNLLHFEKSQVRLNPKDQPFISALGQTLKQQSPHFRTVSIEVSVRSSGQSKKDQQLSEARAQSIRNAIVSSGALSSEKIRSQGLGESALQEQTHSPFDPTGVDLAFTGLTNPDSVTGAINQLFLRFSTPETCRGALCR
ncbi:MAG: OmpA family [Pseudomonadota bacterium]|jgi:outer membrane protein OmpA-like peptidoglycan-associated protein